MAAGGDAADEIDARHHRELAHDGAFIADGERVFVVQRGVSDVDGHIMVGQLGFVEGFQVGAVALLIIFND